MRFIAAIIVALAMTTPSTASELSGRLYNVVEGAAFALALVAIFFIIALVAKLAFKVKIGTAKSYTAVLVIGFALHYGLVAVLSKHLQQRTHAEYLATGSALDAPFAVPPRDEIERFVKQLDQAIQQLSSAEKEQLQEAFAFLVVALADAVAKRDPEKARSMSDEDLQARTFVRLYRFAQKKPHTMTLRKYLLLADEAKKNDPELWARFQQAKHATQEGKK